ALAPRAVNALLAVRPAAALAKRLAGIDPRRSLPRFAERPFTRVRPPGAVADGAARVDVVGWVDTFTGYFTPWIATAAIEVLTRAGLTVGVPRAALCCGLTWISTGQLEAARRRLRRTVRALARHAGTPIVALEPSCAAVLRSDAVNLLGADDRDAVAVAG